MGNCSYAVELGKKMGLQLPGTGGKDIYDRIKILVLGFVWQLMREYTISLLKRLNPNEKKSNREVLMMFFVFLKATPIAKELDITPDVSFVDLKHL